jgi:hypothetical protein
LCAALRERPRRGDGGAVVGVAAGVGGGANDATRPGAAAGVAAPVQKRTQSPDACRSARMMYTLRRKSEDAKRIAAV